MAPTRKQVFLEFLAEVMLSLLPMILVLLITAQVGRMTSAFHRPEWAFAAAIFFGQAIVRVVAAIARRHENLHAGSLSVVVASLILLGFVPACTIVVFILFIEEHDNFTGAADFLAVVPFLQLPLFCLSAMVYVAIGVAVREMDSQQQ